MKLDTWVCDHCGKQRDKDANHWLVLDAHNELVTIRPWTRTCSSDLDGKRHVCGEECAFALLARYFATGGFSPSPKEWSENRTQGKILAAELLARVPLFPH
jgi:hypothetical protein